MCWLAEEAAAVSQSTGAGTYVSSASALGATIFSLVRSLFRYVFVCLTVWYGWGRNSVVVGWIDRGAPLPMP